MAATPAASSRPRRRRYEQSPATSSDVAEELATSSACRFPEHKMASVALSDVWPPASESSRDVAAAIACKRVPRGAALDGPPRHGPVSGVDGHLQRGLRRAHGLGRARHGAALLLPGAALSLSKSLGLCSPLCFTKRGAGVSYFSPLETTRPILLGGGYWRLCDLMDGERRSRPRPTCART